MFKLIRYIVLISTFLCIYSYSTFALETDACYTDTGVLMLHMNGTDGSTTFTDSSASSHTVTANGNAQIDTAQFKFDSASGLFDGTGDYLTSTDSADWFMGTGDFTIDFWWRFNSVTGNAWFISQASSTTNIVQFIKGGNNLVIQKTEGGIDHTFLSYDWITNDNPTTGVWYHLAVTRSSNTFRIFVDGVEKASGTSSEDWFDISGSLYIGERIDGAGYINGWMDSLRIVKGTALWTNSFTPPCQAAARRRLVPTCIAN